MINDHHLRGRAGEITALIPFDKSKRHVDAGGYPSGGPDWAVCYENAVHFDPDFWEAPLEFPSKGPVCSYTPLSGRTPSVARSSQLSASQTKG